jgi:acetylornithine deacetylase
MHDLHGLGENRVGALFVVGEETCSDGAKAAAKALEPMQFIINGEPTELKLVRAQKGALALRLSTTGVAAHSGYPELGSSAIHTLLDALHQIRSQTWPSDPEMGPTFVNVGSLRGGTAANVLANHAQADLMLRVVTAPEKIAEQICALLDPYTRVELLTQSGPQHLYVPPGRDSIVVGYASDVAHLRPLGPLLMVGPGSIHVAHTDHEKIQVADLEQARILYRELCLELLTKGLQ